MSDRLCRDPVHDQILTTMQRPLLATHQVLPSLQQICRPKHRAPRKMARIDFHYAYIFTILGGKVTRTPLGLGVAVVDANHRRRNVTLVEEVRKREVGEGSLLVDDRCLVLRAEAFAKGVASLGATAMDTVDCGGNGGGCLFDRGGVGGIGSGGGEGRGPIALHGELLENVRLEIYEKC